MGQIYQKMIQDLEVCTKKIYGQMGLGKEAFCTQKNK